MTSQSGQRQNQNQKLRLLQYFDGRASQWHPISESYFKGSNALFKYLFFKITRPFRRWIDPRCSADMIPIHLMLFNQPGTRASIHSPVQYHQPNLLSERRFMVPISDALAQRGVYTQIIEGYLSTMSIPQDIQPHVIQDLYKVIQVAEPGLYVEVIIVHVKVNILGNSPAPAKSVFHLLDKVSLDALESEYRKKQCTVCCESLDYVHDDAEEGITRLPCNHLFHVGCLAQLLEGIPHPHVCPICLYPFHTRGSEPSDWPMFLIFSAGYCLTCVLIRGLVKRMRQ